MAKHKTTPTAEADSNPTPAPARDVLPSGLKWTLAHGDIPRPEADPRNFYLLALQGKGELRLAPGLYGFFGWGWRSMDDRSDDTIADESVVAWAAVPMAVRQ